MRVIITGSREADNPIMLVDAVRKSRFNITTVISGNARGADQLGERYAVKHGIPLEKYPADWGKYGKSAGYLRNCEMVEQSEALIALWDGESKGTEHMINLAERKGLYVHAYYYDDLIQTSSFLSKGINIAIKPPSWFQGDSYPELLPHWSFLNEYKQTGDKLTYTNAYYELVLNKLDPFKVWNDLAGQTLLCWCRSGDFCHRRIIACWLEMRLGVFVPEKMTSSQLSTGYGRNKAW